MASFEKFIKGYEDKKESNGYPTKRNHAGNQQNYIPSGEEPFGNHAYFYNKDGKYYSTGFDNDEDKEVSVDEMAKIYDDYIAKQKK